MRLLITSSLWASLLACESSTGVSQRSVAEYSSASKTSQDSKPSTNIPEADGQSPWIGIVPEKAILTTQKIINNMTFIDSDTSMATELPIGLINIAEQSSKLEKNHTQTGFEVVSADHAFLVVDNSSQLFTDGERTTIVNKVLTNSTLKVEIIQLLTEQFQKDPDYAKKYLPSITILTDGDIPANDQQELLAFLKQRFPDGQVYFHLIASPDVVPASDWCQPEAQPSQWLLIGQQFPHSLRLSLCDADWYGHFRSIGKRVIYDQAVARITLPSASVVANGKPYIRFNQRAFPTDLYQYSSESRQIEIRLVDMPTNIQTIDIGFQP